MLPQKPMVLLKLKTKMTVIDPSATIVENELGILAETAIEIESEESAAPRSRESTTATRMELRQVIMTAHMEVSRVGAEAEVEMMTADTHAATEIALMKLAAEMETITEAAVACAHGLGAQTETFTAHEIVAIALMSQEKTVGTEMNVARAEAQSEIVLLH
jgi:hypothetical protein